MENVGATGLDIAKLVELAAITLMARARGRR
jgi:hypothetical protein